MVIDAVCIMKNAKPKKILDEKVCIIIFIIVLINITINLSLIKLS